MSKYKNISKYRLMVYQNGKTHNVMPDQEIDVDVNPYPGLLVQVGLELIEEKPATEDIAEEKIPEEIPEDLIVIVSDAIVEDLKQQNNKKPRRKRRNQN